MQSDMSLLRARRNVAVLLTAQALLGMQLPMIFTIGGLAGQNLASNICFATLPISLIVFGSMVAATPMGSIMQNYGRRFGFLLGAGFGALGAIIAAWGLYLANFPLFLFGSFITGGYMSAQGFFRFAATDTAPDNFKPKAISFVMAGGLISALLGPQLVKLTSDWSSIPFLGVYVAVVAINIIGGLVFFGLDIPKPIRVKSKADPIRTRAQMLRSPVILGAIICATAGYALMNFVMTATPLAVVGCGFSQNNAADVVGAHVAAMFAPSFFTGYLITRFGVIRIIAIGLSALAAAGIVGLSNVELLNFFGALVLLGIGWNFTFIGATSLLSTAHSPSERGRVQGLNDTIVFGFVTIASVASGGLMNCSGGDAIAGWQAVNMTVFPFLVIAALALFWITRQQRNGASA